MKTHKKYLLTGSVVLIAVLAVLFKYWDHVVNPWTRDGQVRAEVIQITPRVSGPIVKLAVKDNQFVKAGDLLFEIDPRTFKASLDQARAQLDETGDSNQALIQQVESAKATVEVSRAAIDQAKSAIKETDAQIDKNRAELARQKELLPKKATSQKSVDRAKANYDVSVEKRKSLVAGVLQAQASLRESEAKLAEARANLGAAGDANPSIRAAVASVRQAESENIEPPGVKNLADAPQAVRRVSETVHQQCTASDVLRDELESPVPVALPCRWILRSTSAIATERQIICQLHALVDFLMELAEELLFFIHVIFQRTPGRCITGRKLVR